MLKIEKFTCEFLENDILTDNKRPSFRYIVSNEKNGITTKSVRVSCNGWVGETVDSPVITYAGDELKPFSAYTASIEIEDSEGEVVSKSINFETGFLGTEWKAQWITDGNYNFTEKKVSPIPMVFRKKIESRFIRSFLSYTPYAVLGALTFPDVFFSTGSIFSATGGAIVAVILGYKGRGLAEVAVIAIAGVYVLSMIQPMLGI